MRTGTSLILAVAAVIGGGDLAGGVQKANEPGKEPAGQPREAGNPDKAPGSASGEAARNDVEVRFVNGSVVVVGLRETKIEVETEYGKLVIPPSDIRNIEFGVHLAAEVQEKIGDCIRKLASESYKERETAHQELIALGPHAYYVLRRLKQPKESEAVRRIQLALAEIEKKVPRKLLRVKEEDKIRTTKFTIVGRIVTPIIRGRAEYFGDLNLKPGQLLSMRRLSESAASQVVVDAAKYALPNKWLETGIKVDAAAGLKFTARGQVDLWPQQPGQYLSGPAGMAMNFGGIAIRGGAQQASGGTLMGRIGTSGAPFVIGDRAVINAGQEGKLFLQIIPTPWGGASSGSYNVRIEVAAQGFEEEDD